MGAGDLITLLSNGGAIVVFCALLITGVIVPRWVHDEVRQDRDDYKKALELEKVRSDTILDVAGVTKDVLHTLRKELTG